jgi:hypothetical protein
VRRAACKRTGSMCSVRRAACKRTGSNGALVRSYACEAGCVSQFRTRSARASATLLSIFTYSSRIPNLAACNEVPIRAGGVHS